MQKAHGALTEKNDRTTTDLEQARHRVQQLQTEHEQTTADLNRKTGVLDEARAEHAQTKTALDNSRHRFQQLQKAHGALTEKNDRTATDLEQARHRVQQLQKAHEQTTADLNRKTGALDEARAEHERVTAALDKAQHDLQQLHAKHERTTMELERATTALDEARAEHEQTKAELRDEQKKYNSLHEEYMQTDWPKLLEEHNQTTTALTEEREKHAEKTDALNALHEEHNALREEHDQTETDLTKARHNFDELDQKYKLVSDLLTPKSSENEAFVKFKKLFDKEFMDFANEESSLADEADAVQKLQSLEKRLEEIVAFPHTFMKKSIAIGGGFSSGKSEFVNSFIKKPDVKMPVGIEPATAIPSFVISNPEVSIKGFSRDGATVDIAPDLYSQLSHRFVESFSFKLKDHMPYITVEVPLDEGLFENICLIDTPGYNPAGGNTGEDRKTAAEVLKDRDALIWMIGLDATGTIPQDDLDFIEDLELNGLPFYVVLNKADLKSPSDLKDILDEVKETLEDVDIEPVGISAYSAIRGKEYSFDEDGVSLHDFFRRENQPKEEIETELRGGIESVFAMYEDAIRKDEHTAELLMKELNSLDLEILSTKIPLDEQDVLSEKIDNIKNSQERDFTPIKAKMEKIKKEMLKAVDDVFWSLRPQGNEAMTRPSSAPAPKSEQASPPPSNKGSAVKRQGSIKGGKYIPTTAEQPEKPSALPQEHSQPPKRTDKPRFENPELPASSNVVTAHREAKISDEQAPQSATEQFEQSALQFINSASADSLADEFGKLRSPDVAKKIVAYRTQNGQFQRLDELRRVRGIGFYTFEQLRKRLWDMRHRLSSNVVTAHREAKISDEQATQTEQIGQSALRFINSESAEVLADRLDLRPDVAKNIVAYRTRNGPFQRLDELRRVRGIGFSFYTFEQLRKRLWDMRHHLG